MAYIDRGPGRPNSPSPRRSRRFLSTDRRILSSPVKIKPTTIDDSMRTRSHRRNPMRVCGIIFPEIRIWTTTGSGIGGPDQQVRPASKPCRPLLSIRLAAGPPRRNRSTPYPAAARPPEPLENPYTLAFLGLARVGAAFKRSERSKRCRCQVPTSPRWRTGRHHARHEMSDFVSVVAFRPDTPHARVQLALLRLLRTRHVLFLLHVLCTDLSSSTKLSQLKEYPSTNISALYG